MSRLHFAIALVTIGGLLSVAAVGSVSAFSPPQPGADESGLDENETASLWSKEPNNCLREANNSSQEEDNRTQLHELGTCTDISFEEPPDTAEIWTGYDFESLEAGGRSTSVYPPHADRQDSSAIGDAHATIFAVQPSTIVHKNHNRTPHYVAPEGELRGLIDYRAEAPGTERRGTRTISWSVLDDELGDVRLKQDNETIATAPGDHEPLLEYDLEGSGSSTLTLEADIEVELERTTTRRIGNQTFTTTRSETDSLTVSSDLEVEVYTLEALLYHAEYPDDEAGIAIYQSQPWHGYDLNDEEAVVRGVWRYYTARDTNWDSLVRSSSSGQDVVDSDARPVYVRAYPSETGPREDPIHRGPTIEEVWGTESPSPNATFHDNVELDVIDEPYTRSYGLAVRYDDIDRDHLEVQGIVRGEAGDLVEPDSGTEREVRESNLSVEVLEQNESEATLQIELRDAETDDPIVLEEPFEEDPRFSLIGSETREGYISVGGKQVQTGAFGVTTVTVSQPGSYTATYHPGSWRTHDPAYVGDTSSTSWHPLSTAGGWFSFLISLLWLLVPFLVALYAGLKLASFLHIPDDHYP